MMMPLRTAPRRETTPRCHRFAPFLSPVKKAKVNRVVRQIAAAASFTIYIYIKNLNTRKEILKPLKPLSLSLPFLSRICFQEKKRVIKGERKTLYTFIYLCNEKALNFLTSSILISPSLKDSNFTLFFKNLKQTLDFPVPFLYCLGFIGIKFCV